MRPSRRNAIALAAQACLLSACGLSERPFVEQRRWPLVVPRPSIQPARMSSKVIELRNLRAAPGMDSDALQTVQPDGSVVQQFYERWAVEPADGVTECLLLWLTQSGRFAAVLNQGSRAEADVALEGTLTSLHADLGQRRAEAVIAIIAIDLHPPGRRILLQASFTGSFALQDVLPATQIRAQLAALADAFDQIERAIPQSS